MNTIKIQVLKFLFRENWKPLQDVLKAYPDANIQEVSSAGNLAKSLSDQTPSLILVAVLDKQDLIELAGFMKVNKKLLKSAMNRLTVINFSGLKQIDTAINKLGIIDTIDPQINKKVLKFKMDLWMRALRVPDQSQKSKFSPTPEKKNAETVDADALPTWTAPLTVVDDMWLTRKETDCKKVLNKWLVRLIGPSPYVGQWNQASQGLWTFEFKAQERDIFMKGGGNWFFRSSQKPEFIWRENVWLLSGIDFDLYYRENEKVTSRVKCRGKSLQISRNSDSAKAKKKIILESLDKDLVFSRTQESVVEEKLSSDYELSLKNLEGKGKTEHLDLDPLSGEINEGEVSHGPLTGGLKEDAASLPNFLEGILEMVEGESDSAESKSRDHSAELSEDDGVPEHDFSADHIEAFWENENAYEEKSRNPSGRTGIEATDTGPKKKPKSASGDADEADAPSKKGVANREERSEDLGGKSSTDHIHKYYGKEASEEKEPREKRKLPSFLTEDDPEQSKRDMAVTAQELSEGVRKKERERALEDLAGEIDAAESKQKALDGQTKTDHLQAHYGTAKSASSEPEIDKLKKRDNSQSHERTETGSAKKEKLQSPIASSRPDSRATGKSDKEITTADPRTRKELSRDKGAPVAAGSDEASKESFWDGLEKGPESSQGSVSGKSATEKISSFYGKKKTSPAGTRDESGDASEETSDADATLETEMDRAFFGDDGAHEDADSEEDVLALLDDLDPDAGRSAWDEASRGSKKRPPHKRESKSVLEQETENESVDDLLEKALKKAHEAKDENVLKKDFRDLKKIVAEIPGASLEAAVHKKPQSQETSADGQVPKKDLREEEAGYSIASKKPSREEEIPALDLGRGPEEKRPVISDSSLKALVEVKAIRGPSTEVSGEKTVHAEANKSSSEPKEHRGIPNHLTEVPVHKEVPVPKSTSAVIDGPARAQEVHLPLGEKARAQAKPFSASLVSTEPDLERLESSPTQALGPLPPTTTSDRLSLIHSQTGTFSETLTASRPALQTLKPDDTLTRFTVIQNTLPMDCHLHDFAGDNLIFLILSGTPVDEYQVRLSTTYSVGAIREEKSFDAFLLAIEENRTGQKYLTLRIDPKHAAEFRSLVGLYEVKNVKPLRSQRSRVR